MSADAKRVLWWRLKGERHDHAFPVHVMMMQRGLHSSDKAFCGKEGTTETVGWSHGPGTSVRSGKVISRACTQCQDALLGAAAP